MKSFDEVLDTLLQLHEGDRQWLVEQLTPAQRYRLATQLDAEPATIVRSSPAIAASPRADSAAAAVRPTHARVPVLASAPTPEEPQRPSEPDVRDAGPNPDVSRLVSAPPQRIAELLRREPAWIAQAVLCDRPRDWTQAVLAQLPHASRLEISRLAQARVALAPAVVNFLLHAAVRQLPNESQAAGGSRFDQLLHRLKQRMRPLAGMRRLS